METERKLIKLNGAKNSKARTTTRKFFLILSCLPVLLAGCAQWPEIATNCAAYGVQENHSPMGTLAHLDPLSRDELKVRCGGVPAANALSGTEISGCVIPHENGSVEAYYWQGDHCAMNHEMCHFRHGPAHTARYLQELQAGIPMPYCPENQLIGG